MSVERERLLVVREAKAMFNDRRPADPRSGLGRAVQALYDAEQAVKDNREATRQANLALRIHLVADPGDGKTMCGLKIKDQRGPFPTGWVAYAQARIDRGGRVCLDCDAAALEAGNPIVGNPAE